jgi:hypothetical protein
MIFKSRLNGYIDCHCNGDVLACRRLLNKYSIPHTVDGTMIRINADIKVMPFFDNEGLRKTILESARRHGEATFDASKAMEEEEQDENATRLLRQRR